LLGRRDTKMAGHLPPAIQAEIALITSGNSVWDSALAYLSKRGHAIPADVLERDRTLPYEANLRVQDVLLAVHTKDPEILHTEKVIDVI
jgi:tryptophan 2,3-dioxygenase